MTIIGPSVGRPCRSGRARFRSREAAAATVGAELVEPGDPTPIRPTGVEPSRCRSCSGWHVTASWSPWARAGSRAARLVDRGPWERVPA